jgi:hypothetical protein
MRPCQSTGPDENGLSRSRRPATIAPCMGKLLETVKTEHAADAVGADPVVQGLRVVNSIPITMCRLPVIAMGPG